ncbi:hypothetical protein [uncultured Thiothrix sp.]|uniref:hypothetical protein n=1 Tax=uncultured Thiothrix sp. TaxID=223185 RepID=UPI0026155C13|nr:hypothetical protein [uncultured Thiothrix sp.]
MYLSNSRLISLFLALLVLTLSLLWLLGNKTHLASSNALNAGETVQLAARQPDTTVVENGVSPIPTLEPAKEATPSAVQAESLATAKPTETPKSEPVSVAPAKTTEVAAIPDNLVLSEKELKALSTKERKRYEKMIENLRSLRDQSTQLTSERQRLEQQMVELEQRNQELTKQLEAVRQTTETATAPIKP